MLERESKATGITSLKIGSNNVFGYYIEVRNTHKDKVPEDWIRKQTLVSAERYITEELKEYENQILGAEEKILNLETQLFQELIQSLFTHLKSIQKSAITVAQLDVLSSFAQLAIENHYVHPQINDSLNLIIEHIRHPLIQYILKPEDPYIANSV